ncbi:flagellar assembly protein T N-terminal domain-containing protein [Alteromonas sp. 1_MG-2023]|uniref:flagellar assembly protein T N-terminal domain-containing protein n=1 Tax=Alteromonas sp. 1_MG-2023 TaxID=3062669 RepID=UPI0026E1F35B|nr:flagellar assembly protein T N-terminal domain-containing protein [Alteromonas sp. 1_MG-2023]MDO6568476.1 flagellar assembly protein T N-terminal domain-containing protein [Alteromonas sp. 1_MG-2023]
MSFNVASIMALFCLTFVISGQSHAAWYEAKGQAIIVNGNKEKARRDATEEALKQALLFAGASISSVQQLTNGLLESEDITISSSGEVDHLELTDEVWHSNYVTVSVRADIFPATKQCSAVDYDKNIATSYFMVENRQHLVEGKIPNFSEAVTRKLATEMSAQAQHLNLSFIAPHTTRWGINGLEENVRALSEKSNAQFVLVGSISDVSVQRDRPSSLAFWKEEKATRYFSLSIKVFDGINSGLLMQRDYLTEADWPFDRFTDVDEFSAVFWRSEFGDAIKKQMHQLTTDISETIACQPLTGRVLDVTGSHLSVSLGRDNGIQTGDTLFVYQTSEIVDRQGKAYLQYHIYPGEFVVENAYGNSAKIIHKGSGIIANIQESDFVIKR